MSPIDRELERALARRADDATPPGDLFSGVERRAAGIRRRRQATVGAVALSVVALAVAVPLALDRGPDRDSGFVRIPTPTATPADTPSPEPSPTATASTPPLTESVPVYWAVDTDRGPRLYREFLPAAAEGAESAVRVLLRGQPADPDYTTFWPRTAEVRDVTVNGTVATVDLVAEGSAPGSAFAQAAVDQMVWTVTAADTVVTSVRFTVGGQPVDSLWGVVDTSEPIVRGSHLGLLGPVWVIAPVEGATVPRTFRIEGDATAYEATVHWEVVDTGGNVVAKDFATADDGPPARGAWEATVTLPAGVPAGARLTIRVMESTGDESQQPHVETKTVVVGA